MQSGTATSDNTKLSHAQLTHVVDCAGGPVRGLIDTETGGHCYLGIPYAQPPVGIPRYPLRPAASW